MIKKHISIRFSKYGASAELSLLSPEEVVRYNKELGANIKNTSNTLYFNRLIVPKELRQKGIATQLMKELVQFLELHKFNVILEVNPYGEMDLKNLIDFYSKFDFKLLFGFEKENSALMVRYLDS